MLYVVTHDSISAAPADAIYHTCIIKVVVVKTVFALVMKWHQKVCLSVSIKEWKKEKKN